MYEYAAEIYNFLLATCEFFSFLIHFYQCSNKNIFHISEFNKNFHYLKILYPKSTCFVYLKNNNNCAAIYTHEHSIILLPLLLAFISNALYGSKNDTTKYSFCQRDRAIQLSRVNLLLCYCCEPMLLLWSIRWQFLPHDLQKACPTSVQPSFYVRRQTHND